MSGDSTTREPDAVSVTKSESVSPRRRHRRLPAGVVVVAVVVGAAVFGRDLLAGGSKSTGAPVYGRVLAMEKRTVTPTLAGATLTGDHLDIADLRGHVVVINVWGSWCDPCRAEAPDLARLSAETKAEGVRFVGVDIRDNSAAGTTFEREYGITYPSIFDGDETATLGFRPWIPIATPTTYVLDGNGRIAAEFFGRTRYADLQPVVQEIVELG
ncbi:TlpA family protein disulfide reductase [Catenulispora rubra]|uniref:TlpA family protein disulfide reductase n=1 Tax=Catenulispora rubra TaxID=280293 RepID=UPI00189278C9|nr:TlpA disulfide reductase family protein [Catenulispora rubra]